MTMQHETRSHPRPTIADAARWLAELYCLWRFCGKHACLRARACRGDTRACMKNLPLVPAEALDFVAGYDDGQAEGLSFDEMMEANEDAWSAVEDWRARVMATVSDRQA